MRAGSVLLILVSLALLMPLAAAESPFPEEREERSVQARPHLIPPSPDTQGWPPHAVQGAPILPEVAQTSGTASVIVLLIEFTDVTHDAARTPAAIDASLNSEVADAKTLRSYYKEVSFGALTVDATVVSVWRPSSRTMSYYGADSPNGIDDANDDIYVLAAEAVKVFDASVDFSTFDTDGNGNVDHLIVVHAGDGQETASTNTDLIWSHRWVVPDDPFLPGSQPLIADGTQIYQYIMVSESSPIGVAAHEFGHDLGLPDLYDTDGSSEGAGIWDIMAGGSWNGNPPGSSPAHLSALSLIRLGWVTPTDVTASLINTQIPSVATTGRVYLLGISGSFAPEYFLVENRQPIGFDSALPGSGLLIWHVDDSRQSNEVDNRRWVDLEEADEAIDPDRPTDSTDPWRDSGAGWGPDTTPHSRSYSGADTGWRVREISASGPTMTATIARDVQEDLAVSEIRLPFMVSVGIPVSVEIDVRNDGAQPGDVDLSVAVYRNAFAPSARVAQNSFTRIGLPPETTANFNFTFDPTTLGRYIVHAALVAASDEIPSNDERAAHVLVNAFHLRDAIELGEGGWTTNDDGSLNPSAHRWRIVDESDEDGAAHSPTHAWRLGFVPTLLPDPFPPEWHILTSPAISLSPGPTFLIFYGRYDLSGRTVPLFPIVTNETDHAYVEVSYDDGATWIQVAHYTGRDLTWRGGSFDLSANITGPTTLRLRFNVSANVMGNSGGWWIDDVMIAELGLGRAVVLLGPEGPHPGPAGGTAQFTLKVANVGEVETAFRLDAVLPEGWGARIEGETSGPLQGHVVRVAPDNDLAVRVVVTISPTATSGAPYTVTISASAVADPSVTASFPVEVRVTGFPIELIIVGVVAAAVLIAVAAVVAKRRRRRPPS